MSCPTATPTMRPAAAAPAIQREALDDREVNGCVNLGNAITRAGRSAASRRRKICACWATRRSAEKWPSASVVASTRMFSSQAENSLKRARHAPHVVRCGCDARPSVQIAAKASSSRCALSLNRLRSDMPFLQFRVGGRKVGQQRPQLRSEEHTYEL